MTNDEFQMTNESLKFHKGINEETFREGAWAWQRVWSPGFSRQGVAIAAGSKHFYAYDQAAFHRLKPGLHTLCASFRFETY